MSCLVAHPEHTSSLFIRESGNQCRQDSQVQVAKTGKIHWLLRLRINGARLSNFLWQDQLVVHCFHAIVTYEYRP
jgi:hypothetical protein